jgi:hypothetical protein
MATLAVIDQISNILRFSGGVGVNANDVVVQTNDVSKYDTFELISTAGAMQVLATLDGTNYTTAPISLTDMGATTSDPVIVTAANRIYRFRGAFSVLKVTQNGATAVTGATLVCQKMGWY